ncbi:Metalloenzyme, LuxS/M16 peptidase-like protein [Paraphysoderma sedebokerense]|nr:Metalloenzyme, LuxS/M16 peptidase-like protein [Paraphysoderma sedebokerense]KAI9137764.1 Metalloenzyme, LuxS/M16 peptidase-like protein [Paraphysoderma sedebokerense]
MLRNTVASLRRSQSCRSFSVLSPSQSVHAEFALPKDIPLEAPLPKQSITQTPTGLRLGTFENFGPTSRLSLVVPGSRYESNGNIGVASFLKGFAFKSTKTQSQIKTIRESELRGVQLSTTLNREYLSYNAEFLRDDLPYVIELFSDILYNTKFNHWELNAVKEQVLEQSASAQADPITAAFESAHRIAFRTGLGNSVFATTPNKIDIQAIKSFASQVLSVGPKAGIFGVGVNHAELSDLVNMYFSASTANSGLATSPSKYFGGESRIDSTVGNHTLVSFNGAALGTKDQATLAVLRNLLGETKHDYHGPGASLLAKFASNVSLNTFSKSYSDAGLFGIVASSNDAAATSQGISKALTTLRNVAGGSHSEDFQRAVKQAEAETVGAAETRAGRIEALGEEAFLGKTVSTNDVISKIKSTSFNDVSSLAQNLLKSKPTVVVVGETRELPYTDTLGF